jgi:7-keto-8-aminopelargonate synthetase-like enzyme
MSRPGSFHRWRRVTLSRALSAAVAEHAALRRSRERTNVRRNRLWELRKRIRAMTEALFLSGGVS